jgi:hypothetical protein
MSNELQGLAVMTLGAMVIGRGLAWLVNRYTRDAVEGEESSPIEFYAQLDCYRDATDERKRHILSEVKRRLRL